MLILFIMFWLLSGLVVATAMFFTSCKHLGIFEFSTYMLMGPVALLLLVSLYLFFIVWRKG